MYQLLNQKELQMKQVKTILLAGSVAFLMSACGGGGSTGSSDSISVESSIEPAATGTSFYIDSAVSGVNYKCGSQEGITAADGSFTFEMGSGCTFYLGDIELRAVDAGLLTDGGNVYETDVEIARILQSLDSDANPDNGITISADMIRVLAEHEITSLPITETELNMLLAVITSNGGIAVSKEDAQNHLNATKLRLLLAGKTLYIPENQAVSTVVFNNSMTSCTLIENGEVSIWTIDRIDGYEIYLDTDDIFIMAVDITDDYIVTKKGQYEETDGIPERLYFDKAKALAYLETLDGGSNEVTATPEVTPIPTPEATPIPTPEATPTPEDQGSNTTSSDAPIIDSTTKQVYLDAINNARALNQDCGENGIKPAVSALVWSDTLYKAAYEHSEDLAESNTFSHDGSGTDSDWTAQVLDLGRGSKFNERIENNGYTDWRTISENIAAGTYRDTAQEAVDAWIESDGHCANLMNPAFKEVGMGHVEKSDSTYTHYWTQNFGAK